MTILLALDASSTTIGWVLLDGMTVRDHGTAGLAGHDVSDRCRQAHAIVGALLRCHPDIDAVAIESGVMRFAKAAYPQALVSGAIRAAVRLVDLHVVDVTPTEAKRALTGKGNTDKARMQRVAAAYGVTGEHAADAVGVALAAVGKVQVMR